MTTGAGTGGGAPGVLALTLHRPWTTCITALPEDAAKRIENRVWSTRYRGDLWLHAGRRFDSTALATLAELSVRSLKSSTPDDHPTGVVALVELVDVCTAGLGPSGAPSGCRCGPWAARGQAHWRLANVRPLVAPVACRGAQRLWALPADVEAACRAQLVDASGAIPVTAATR